MENYLSSTKKDRQQISRSIENQKLGDDIFFPESEFTRLCATKNFRFHSAA